MAKRIGALWDPRAFSRNTPVASAADIYGFTGHNTGNMAYIEGIRSLLGVADTEFVSWGASPELIKSRFDVLIFPAANQLGAHTELGDLADRFYSWDTPIVALGLGAQAKTRELLPELTPGTQRWLQALVDLAPVKGKPNIVTRGDFTQYVLEQLGHGASSVSAGCPSQFINRDGRLGERLRKAAMANDFFSLAYNSSHYSWAWAKPYDALAIQYISRNAGSYIVQAPLEMMEWAKTRNRLDMDGVASKIRRFCGEGASDSEFYRFTRNHVRAFATALSWREHLSYHDFSVGTRIHGAMLSLQTAIPALLITHDTRTEELAQKMGVPYAPFTELDPGELVDFNSIKNRLADYDWNAIDRSRFANFRNFRAVLDAAGIECPYRFDGVTPDSDGNYVTVSASKKSNPSVSMERLLTTSDCVIELGSSQSVLSGAARSRLRYRFIDLDEPQLTPAAVSETLANLDAATLLISFHAPHQKLNAEIVEALLRRTVHIICRRPVDQAAGGYRQASGLEETVLARGFERQNAFRGQDLSLISGPNEIAAYSRLR